MSKRPVVFLDRDGTLNVEVGYIRELTDLNLIEGAGEAVRLLNDGGVACVLTTNQSGAARGYYGEEHIGALNERLVKLLAGCGASLDAVYYCPHLSPEDGGVVAPYNIACSCRKPAVGMVERAYSEHPEFSRELCFVVGDKATDVEQARNCGARAVLVQTGYGKKVLDGSYQWSVEADYVCDSIVEASKWILSVISQAAETSSNAGAKQ